MLYLYVSSYARAPLKNSAGWCKKRERERERAPLKKIGWVVQELVFIGRVVAIVLCQAVPALAFFPWQFNSDSRVKPSPLLVAGAIFYADLSLSLSL
ncbi:hypothetical protein AMTRI_Chr03g49230 [Amborella trichopoda]